MYLEALVAFLPTEAGGLERPIAPREGTYRPHVRAAAGEPLLRIRFIEGPPLIAPGHEGRVVIELETDAPLDAGCELDVIEEERVIAVLNVTRIWRTALSAG